MVTHIWLLIYDESYTVCLQLGHAAHRGVSPMLPQGYKTWCVPSGADSTQIFPVSIYVFDEWSLCTIVYDCHMWLSIYDWSHMSHHIWCGYKSSKWTPRGVSAMLPEYC